MNQGKEESRALTQLHSNGNPMEAVCGAGQARHTGTGTQTLLVASRQAYLWPAY